jgi:hypothetical protein
MSWKMGSCRATRACCLNAIQGLPVVHRHLLQGASELGRCRVAGGRCALPSRRGRQGADRRLCTPQQLIVTTQLVQPLAPVAKYAAVSSPWENKAKKQGALCGRGADGDTSLADHRSRRWMCSPRSPFSPGRVKRALTRSNSKRHRVGSIWKREQSSHRHGLTHGA